MSSIMINKKFALHFFVVENIKLNFAAPVYGKFAITRAVLDQLLCVTDPIKICVKVKTVLLNTFTCLRQIFVVPIFHLRK